MNRRTLVFGAGAAGLALITRPGFTDTDASVTALLKLLEDSPRQNLPHELARRIRAGLRYEELLAALSLAAVRNVQPYPDVGFKYHAVLVLRSIHSTTEHLSTRDQWLPIAWAADYFKATQAQERATSGWHLPTRPATAVSSAPAARRALITALDNWDRDPADAAIVNYAQVARPDEIFGLLFPYGARDLRDIGHKAIAVSNAHSLIALLGSAHAEPILRSTVAALQNSEGDPNPASRELRPDIPWRRNQKRLREIPPSWRQGRNDPGARVELRAALYRVSEEDAGTIVVEMLQRGISPDAIWQVLFDTAAELFMHLPSVVSLHAQTTANALHYAFRVCGNEQTQQLMLLQCAAFVVMFRELTGTTRTDFSLEALQPLPLEGPSVDAIDEVFSDVSAGRRLQAAGKALGCLQGGGDGEALIARARHNCVYNADEPHDYKFSEAVFDNYAHLSDASWRSRFLSANLVHLKARAARPSPVVAEMLELLQT
jgi:hypothetical protein